MPLLSLNNSADRLSAPSHPPPTRYVISISATIGNLRVDTRATQCTAVACCHGRWILNNVVTPRWATRRTTTFMHTMPRCLHQLVSRRVATCRFSLLVFLTLPKITSCLIPHRRRKGMRSYPSSNRKPSSHRGGALASEGWPAFATLLSPVSAHRNHT